MFLCGSTLSINALFWEKIAYIAVYPQIDHSRSLFCHPSKAILISLKLVCLDMHVLRFMRKVDSLSSATEMILKHHNVQP